MKKGIVLVLVFLLVASFCYAADILSTGNVVVTSSPGGADIYVNGVYAGTTSNGLTAAPIIKLGLKDPSEIKISKTGYKDYITTVTGEIQDKRLDVTLVPMPIFVGAITVVSTPGGAEAFLDGVSKGITSTGTTAYLKISDVTPGVDHKLVLKKQGYADYTTTVNLFNGENRRVDLTLVLANGVINVDSQPQGAKISVDGADTGKVTPAKVEYLSTGDHTVTLDLAGYVSSAGNVAVTSGQVATVNRQLDPIAKENTQPQQQTNQEPQTANQQAAQPEPKQQVNEPAVAPKSGNGYIWAIILIVIIVGAAWYVSKKNKK